MLMPLLHTDEPPLEKEIQTAHPHRFRTRRHVAECERFQSVRRNRDVHKVGMHRHTLHRHNHLAVPRYAKLGNPARNASLHVINGLAKCKAYPSRSTFVELGVQFTPASCFSFLLISKQRDPATGNAILLQQRLR